MKIKVNATCNVNTDEDAHGFRSAGRNPRPQITIPSLKARLSIWEATTLIAHLAEALKVARDHEETGERAEHVVIGRVVIGRPLDS